MANRAIGDGIDWGRIHLRLEASRRALERGFAPDPDEKRRILRARAKRLAREPASQVKPAGSLDVVEFLLAHERYVGGGAAEGNAAELEKKSCYLTQVYRPGAWRCSSVA